MSDVEREAWFDHMRATFEHHAMGGYGKLCEPDPELRRFFTETAWASVMT
jgi:hypothetical protein